MIHVIIVTVKGGLRFAREKRHNRPCSARFDRLAGATCGSESMTLSVPTISDSIPHSPDKRANWRSGP